MNAVHTWLQSTLLYMPWAERVGWTLLHSLWQITIIAFIYALVSVLLRKHAATWRYALGCLALLVMMGTAIGTCLIVPLGSAPAIPDLNATRAHVGPPAGPPIPFRSLDATPLLIEVSPESLSEAHVAQEAERRAIVSFDVLRPFMPWVTMVWLLGVCTLSLRPIGGWLHIRHLQRHGLLPLPAALLTLARHSAQRLGVTRAVRFVQSTLVEVPTVVGLMRPFVLLPVSAVSGLAPVEIEMILAHELAHIRRCDTGVNLVQTVIESLLFFHPAMWWVSKQVRKERENCCDDMAVAVSGNRVQYVQALTRLEAQRSAGSVAVLAATGGSLLDRVRRLLGQPSAEFGYRSVTAWLSVLVAIVVVSLALAMGASPQDGQDKRPGELASSGQSTEDITEPGRVRLPEIGPDNPLGLDNATLIRLFNTGKTLRSAARECVSYHAKYDQIPPNAASLFEDYQQFQPDMIVDPFAAQGGVLHLTQRMHGPDDNWLQVWSVGPDGDWDGGRVIDASDASLDGDLGCEMRMGKWRFNWLVQETLAMHLDGKPLSHYLAAQAPPYPGPINPHQTLGWGPVTDGLRMAANPTRPNAPYTLGTAIEIDFHVRNVSPYPITIAGFAWRQGGGPDSFVVKNDQGETLGVVHPFYTGFARVQRNTLKTGEVAVFTSSPLAFLAEGMPGPERPVGHKVMAGAGQYTLQCTLHFPGGSASGRDSMPRPTDWQGTLRTGVYEMVIVDPPGSAEDETPEDEIREKVEAAEVAASAEAVRARSISEQGPAVQRFLTIERFARLPMDEQVTRLAKFYRDLDPRSMSSIVEGILSSAPHHILDRYKEGDPYDGNTEQWARQLADAASEMRVEQVADKLGGSLWLNVASRARALDTFKHHENALHALITADLNSREPVAVDRACTLIVSLGLRSFTARLMDMYLAEDELSRAAWGALVWIRHPAIVPMLLKSVDRDPRSLLRCSGLFLGSLSGKPAEPQLFKLLNSPDADIRYHAAYALQECRDPELAQPTVQLAHEKDARFRSMAAQWASKLPHRSFLTIREELLPLLSDPNETVRFDALRSFGQRKDLAAGPVILALLQRDGLRIEQQKIVVMQAMSSLSGNTRRYDMHNWGSAKPGNQRAIEQFKAWLKTQQDHISILGTVTGIDGKPAVGYRVTALPRQGSSNSYWPPMVMTDHYGEFIFRGLPSGPCEVSVTPNPKTNQPNIRVLGVDLNGDSTIRVVLSLEQKYSFKGRFTDTAGRPQPDRHVLALWRDPTGGATYSSNTKTDPEGRYSFSSPFEEAARILINDGNHRDGLEHRNVQQGREDIDFQLNPPQAASWLD
ncbi:MAG: hypothetical protein HQ515_06150 [Phycisphaeraceae bacterium]|nr:hypothetical protein [Phycisphaeraceae bacterium]